MLWMIILYCCAVLMIDCSSRFTTFGLSIASFLYFGHHSKWN